MYKSALHLGSVFKLSLLFVLVTAAMAAPMTYNASTGLPGAIVDVSTTNFTLTVPDSVVITDVNVGINLTHTFDGDLEIYIISPLGTTVLLSDNRGGSGDNFTNTIFDDEAGTSIAGGSSPFTGSFIPDNPLSALDGENALGLWTLRFIDTAGGDAGTLLGWSVTIDGNAPPSSVPEPGTLSLLGIAGLALIGIRRRRKV